MLVVEDNALMRSAVSALLRRHPDIEVASETASTLDALQVLSNQHIDVIVLDLRLGGSNRDGIQFATTVRHNFRLVRIVIYSGYLADHYTETLVNLNVYGYVSKTDPPSTVVDAVRGAAKGEIYVSPEVYRQIAKKYRSR